MKRLGTGLCWFGINYVSTTGLEERNNIKYSKHNLDLVVLFADVPLTLHVMQNYC